MAKRRAPRGEIGDTGLKQWGGVIREEFIRDLTGNQAVKVYKEMAANDAIVGAMLFAIETLARKVSWAAVGETDAPDDIDAAEFIESCLNDMSTGWSNFIAEVLSFLIFGWSYHEIVYKLRLGPEQPTGATRSKFTDGKVGWRKLPIRSQDTLLRWEFDDNNGLRGLWQMPPRVGKRVFIPIEKSLLFRTTSHKGNPEGQSILRRAYRPWYFKKRLEEVEAIAIEREGTGIPVARVPSAVINAQAGTPEAATYTAFKELVVNLRSDSQAGVVLSSDREPKSNEYLYTIELITTPGSRTVQVDPVIQRHSRHIAMTALADFILLGHEKVGSFALASSKTNLFANAMGAFLDEIAGVMSTHAIPRLLRLNDMAGSVVLEHGDIETVDLDVLGRFLKDATAAGIDMGDDATDAWIREIAGMPERSPDLDDDGSLAGSRMSDDDLDIPAIPNRQDEAA